MNKDSIIYIAPNKASFIVQDVAWLKKKVDVTDYYFHYASKILVPWSMCKLFIQLIFSKRRNILVSFGGYHSWVASMVAKLKKVECYIILNGTDSVSIPDWNYGHLRKGLLRICCKQSYEWSTALLPVSDSLVTTENSYAFSEVRQLGILKEFPSLKTEIITIPNGFDIDFWQRTVEKKPDTFITVAGRNRIDLKGVDLILELAKTRPNDSFSIAGMDADASINTPENVHFLGYLSKEELRNAYARSQYYFQLSIWEGFGCALCEAMLCECIPIVSSVNMLPEVVQDDRLVLKRRSQPMLADHLIDIKKTYFNGAHFRKMIVDRYPIATRINSLMDVLGVTA